jgi:hypothetical protein
LTTDPVALLSAAKTASPSQKLNRMKHSPSKEVFDQYVDEALNSPRDTSPAKRLFGKTSKFNTNEKSRYSKRSPQSTMRNANLSPVNKNTFLKSGNMESMNDFN